MQKITRPIPNFLGKEDFEKNLPYFFQRIGEVVWTWNHLHATLYSIFEELIDNEKDSKSLWDTCISDKSQRDMLRTIIKNREISKVLNDIVWALDKIDNFSKYRNSYMHCYTLIDLENSAVTSDTYRSKEKHYQNFELLSQQENFIGFINNIISLETFLRIISDPIAVHSSYPEKPKLFDIKS